MTTILEEIRSAGHLNMTTREIDCPACDYTFVFLKRYLRRGYVAYLTRAFLDHDKYADHGFWFPEHRDDAIRELIARWERPWERSRFE
jgi:hypothetical protein